MLSVGTTNRKIPHVVMPFVYLLKNVIYIYRNFLKTTSIHMIIFSTESSEKEMLQIR